MAFPQHGVHFPVNSSHAADTPQSDPAFLVHPHPQSATTPYSHPLLGQPHCHAGILRDVLVSNWHRDHIPPLTFMMTHVRIAFSSHQRMLLVVIDQTRTGRTFPHLSKILSHKLNHKTCSMLTWDITAWPVIPLRNRGIVVILSATIPESFRETSSKQHP